MAKKIDSTDQAWDERTLGASMDHVAVAPAESADALDEALGLQHSAWLCSEI